MIIPTTYVNGWLLECRSVATSIHQKISLIPLQYRLEDPTIIFRQFEYYEDKLADRITKSGQSRRRQKKATRSMK